MRIGNSFVLQQSISRKLIEPRIDDLARTAADKSLHDASATELWLPSVRCSRRHSRDPAQRLAHNQRFFVVRRALRTGGLEANIAVTARFRVDLAKVTQNRLLPACVRVGELDDDFQLLAVAALLFAQFRRIEFQLRAGHVRLEQTRAANATARNIEAIDVTLAIQYVQRGIQHHVVAVSLETVRHLLERKLQFMFFISRTSQHLVRFENERGRRIAAVDKKFLHARIGVIEKQLASSGFIIASRATSFLIISLDASWNFKVRDKTYVGAIDSHAESVGRDHNVFFAAHECVLRAFALFFRHAGVIKNA